MAVDVHTVSRSLLSYNEQHLSFGPFLVKKERKLMSYNFDLVGVTPIWTFFKHQQQVERSPQRSCVYLGSYKCTLDSFIEATSTVYQKPDWDWEAIVSQMIGFWLQAGDRIAEWKLELERAEEGCLVVGRVANYSSLRSEFEGLIEQ